MDQHLFGHVDEQQVWQSKDFTTLSDKTFGLLKEWMAQYQPESHSYSCHVVLCSAIHRFGHKFTDIHTSLNDSRAVFRQTEGAKWQIGSILGIFSHAAVNRPTQQMWAIIQPFEELAPAETTHDQWRSYPVIGSCLFHNKWNGTSVLVDVHHIRCHFAWCVLDVAGINGECLLALPLNKVSPVYTWHTASVPSFCTFSFRCKNIQKSIDASLVWAYRGYIISSLSDYTFSPNSTSISISFASDTFSKEVCVHDSIWKTVE
jgi:hypothetical protein